MKTETTHCDRCKQPIENNDICRLEDLTDVTRIPGKVYDLCRVCYQHAMAVIKGEQ